MSRPRVSVSVRAAGSRRFSETLVGRYRALARPTRRGPARRAPPPSAPALPTVITVIHEDRRTSNEIFTFARDAAHGTMQHGLPPLAGKKYRSQVTFPTGAVNSFDNRTSDDPIQVPDDGIRRVTKLRGQHFGLHPSERVPRFRRFWCFSRDTEFCVVYPSMECWNRIFGYSFIRGFSLVSDISVSLGSRTRLSFFTALVLL